LLRDQRLATVQAILQATGVDVSARALAQAERWLKLDCLPEARRERIELSHSPLTDRDRRLVGDDAAALVEVIEHFDPPRLDAVEATSSGGRAQAAPRASGAIATIASSGRARSSLRGPRVWVLHRASRRSSASCAANRCTASKECVFAVLALESEPVDPRL
jgi:hypothetical protein